VADKEKNVVLNFRMDGQVQYAKTLREINAIMNTAAKEYKNHIAAMGDDAKITDKLRAEKKKLEVQMEAARKRTEMLRAQYEEMSKSTKTTTGQLTQMYNRLLDSERAEMSLQRSLDRVNEGLSEEAQEARKAQEELEQLKSESSLLETEQKKLTSSFKLQAAQLGENATEADRVELAQKQLSQQMALTERVVSNLENQLDRAKKVYGENSREVMQLETKLNQAKTEIAQFGSKLESLKSSGNKAEQGLDGVNKKLSADLFMEVADAIQGVTDKLLELGKTAMDMGLSFGDSQTYLQANLGITAKEAEKLNDVVDEVFKNGVVGSMDEASEAVMLVKQQFGDLNNADLEKLTNQITTISKRTGTDVKDNVLAAKRLMKEFGLTGQESLDFIAAGFMNGLDITDDFLDTLNEYSPHFEAAGYSADQMFQIIKNGLENGSMNADKAADAVKELQIKLGDGSFEKIMDSFSADTQKVFEDWEKGKATVADVAESISQDLNKMTPTEQQKALSLLSTQFEDLGIDGAAALFSVGNAFTDVTGKAEEMSQKSPGEKWQSSLRELQTSLAPIGQNLVDTLTPVVDILSTMADWFGKLPEPVQTFVIVFGGLIAVAAIAIPVIFGLAAAVTALQVPLLPIIGIILAVAAAIAGIIVVVQNWGKITDWIREKWNQFTSWLSENVSKAKETFVNKFNEMKQGAVNKFNELKEGAVEKFNNLRDKAAEIIRQTKEKIISPIREAKVTIGEIVDEIKGFFSGLKLKIPKIELPKLPKFKISGEFSLKPPSVPKISVDWRAKGAIFTQPTIFGMYGGRLQGAGEAGPEAALPLNEETLGMIGKGIAATMGGANGNVEVHVYLDADELNTKLAPGMSRKLNQNNKIKARGQGVVFV
jgi:phage-related minor tail protein